MSDYILEVESLHKSFLEVQVLNGVDLRLRRNKILGICGENGAGKSTLMNVLGGIYKCNSGKMLLDGEEYIPHSPRDARKHGIAFIHQELNLFTNLTVIQNFMIDNLPKKKPLNIIDNNRIADVANSVMNEFDIDIDLNACISDLDMGHRQMVEIVKEIAKDAKIIIFDEPTTSLSKHEKESLFKIIDKLKERGYSIIYISHILEDVFKLCDDLMVLRDGFSVISNSINEFTKDSVIQYMVNRELKNLYPKINKNIGDIVFSAKNITNDEITNDVSIDLRKGEIVGLFGLMGAGRSEFVRTLYGVDKIDSGSVYIRGKKINKLNPIEMKKNGVAFITENRREEGLLLDKTIKSNIVLCVLDKIKSGNFFIDKKKEEAISEKKVEELKIKTFNKNTQTAEQLSGGNQQKVVISKWLLTEPDILFLDEPTRGIDVGAKYEIYTHINNLAAQGTAILVVSSEMDELIGICDKILVMKNGEISGKFDSDNFNQEGILKYAIEGSENDKG